MKKQGYVLGLLIAMSNAMALPLSDLTAPPGFQISIYAQVPDAREMALGEDGVVFVGTRKDKVYAVVPNSNYTATTTVIPIASGLNSPNGVAFYQHDLYVAEINRVIRFDNIEQHLKNPPRPTIINQDLPSDPHHGWHYIKFGPDHKLYIAIGAPCNACLVKDPFASIIRMQANGKETQIYARGIRNSVGFDWEPISKILWFTDNGRDWLGDNSPPDELNQAPKAGLHFGFPYVYGDNIADKEFYSSRPDQIHFTSPELNLPAHVAALGMVFYTGKNFPGRYRNQIFIAEHGSWNRTEKTGYQVIAVTIKNNHAVEWAPFISGWLQGKFSWGRPVDLLVMPDGALLISDDANGVIYRVIYRG